MGSEGLGECSRKTDGDNSGDDGSGDAERPLKKARYVWQVKGKYHLKGSFNNGNKDSNEPSESNSAASAEQSSNEELENNLNNNNTPACRSFNGKCNGRCCIEALLAQADMMMDSEESSDDEGSLPNLDRTPKNLDRSISDEIPVTLVKPNFNKNQDYYLSKWQARQVAKGYMDNTINAVLETCMAAPFDASDLIENLDNDVQVEDEGILMAIQSHGLQPGVQNWGESSSNQDNGETNSVSFLRSQEIAESAMDNYQNVHNELLKKQLTSAESSDDQEADNNFENMEMGDHTNFLDAAVAVAIQKKGLTSQNYV